MHVIKVVSIVLFIPESGFDKSLKVGLTQQLAHACSFSLGQRAQECICLYLEV